MLTEAIRLLKLANDYSIRLQMGEDWCRDVDALLAAHNAGAREPVAWRYQSEDPLDGGEWLLSDTKPNRRNIQPLYTHPQPLPQTNAARDAKDAKRYRLLREHYFARADNPNTSAYHCVGIFTSWMHAPTIDREGLDAVLDAEIERIARAKGER